MLFPFIIKLPIKKLQKKHEKLIQEALDFLTKNKLIAYSKIKEAEEIATRIQHLKKRIPNY